MTTMPTAGRSAEQTRALYPDEEGYVERDGVRVFWEHYGSGEPTVLLTPCALPGRPAAVLATPKAICRRWTRLRGTTPREETGGWL